MSSTSEDPQQPFTPGRFAGRTAIVPCHGGWSAI
jgi:hypothetical protein